MSLWSKLFARPKKPTPINGAAITASIYAAQEDVIFAEKYARMAILNSFERTASCADAEADIHKRAKDLRKRSHARLQTINDTAEEAVSLLLE